MQRPEHHGTVPDVVVVDCAGDIHSDSVKNYKKMLSGMLGFSQIGRQQFFALASSQ
jgi:hypothetical protein